MSWKEEGASDAVKLADRAIEFSHMMLIGSFGENHFVITTRAGVKLSRWKS